MVCHWIVTGKCDCTLSSQQGVCLSARSMSEFLRRILIVLRVFSWHVCKERVLQCALGTYPPFRIIRQHAKYHVNKVFIVSSIFRIWFSANHSLQGCDWVCARDYFRWWPCLGCFRSLSDGPVSSLFFEELRPVLLLGPLEHFVWHHSKYLLEELKTKESKG